jgi:hypothetical protein
VTAPAGRDGPSPFNEPKRMPRQPIELARIALTSGALQRFDSSAAKLGRLFFFRLRLELGHGGAIGRGA